MKTSKLFILLFCLLQFSLMAQVQLSVEGDAFIGGKILTGNAESTIIIGNEAGQNLTGDEIDNNVILGTGAAGNSTTGFENTILGRAAGLNFNGVASVIIGRSAGALSSSTDAVENVFVGNFAGLGTQSGGNTFVGERAGSSANNTGISNTFIGRRTGISNTSGSFNAFMGLFAGDSNTSGDENVFIGKSAGDANTTGNRNTFVGTEAGKTNINGATLVAIGYEASPGANFNNVTALGSRSVVTADNRTVIGNVAMTEIQGYSNWGSLSDGRFKTNVQENVHGLDFILQLRPVTFQVDAQGLDNFLRKPTSKADNSAVDVAYQTALAKKASQIHTGFIAQEVEQAAEKTGFTFSGVVEPANENDHYSLRYAEFVVPLVKAVQELNDEVAEKDEQIAELETRIAKLEALITAGTTSNAQPATINPQPTTSFQLPQNRPNPSDGNTIIEFDLPKSIAGGKLVIVNQQGVPVKEYPVLEGHNFIRISAGELPTGTYSYSLIANDKLLDTKQLVIVD